MNETTSILPDTPVSNNQETQFSIPKWYSRLAAFIIDNLILGIPFYLIFFGGAAVIGVATSDLSDLVTEFSAIFFGIVLISIFLLINLVYFSYLQSKSGQTWGMRFIGIKLTNQNGELLSFKDALIRNLFVILVPSVISIIPFLGNFLYLAYMVALIIFVLVAKNNQGFHDKIVKAIYQTADEKIQRSKWTLGCFCGCQTFLAIGVIIAAIIFGLGTLSSLENANKELKNLRLPAETQIKQPEQMIAPTNETPSYNYPEPMESTEFYKACMKANTNPAVDLTDYCGCAEKEYEFLTPVSEIPEKCKEYIIRR